MLVQTETSPPTSTFERELSEYLGCLGLPSEHRDHAAVLCREHDFSAARVHLVVSRPGRHTGTELLMYVHKLYKHYAWSDAAVGDVRLLSYSTSSRCLCYLPCIPICAGAKLSSYGHMAVRRLLSRERFPDTFAKAPMIAQFSSLGSINEDWLREFRHSMASGLCSSGASSL